MDLLAVTTYQGGMMDPYRDVPNPTHTGPNNTGPDEPGWAPYLYTSGVFVAFVLFVVSTALFGDYLAAVPYGWLIWLALFALSGLAELWRQPTRRSSGFWDLILAVGFALLAWAHRDDPERWNGSAHVFLAGLYYVATIKVLFNPRLKSNKHSTDSTEPLDLSRPYFEPKDEDR